MFDVEVTKHINYDNYVSKEVVIDGRIILNGNRLFFLEPLESSSTQSYMEVVLNFGRILQSECKLDNLNYKVLTYIKQLQNFVLWHYQFGSKYDTPFWNYAKKLTFSDPLFYSKLEKSMKSEWNNIHYNVLAGNDTDYAQWNNYSIKLWHEGMTHFYKKGTRQ